MNSRVTVQEVAADTVSYPDRHGARQPH